MKPLMIDKEKCNKDGICAAECPIGIIGLTDSDGYPQFIAGGEKMCIACGHCVAVCPHGALNHDEVPLEACPPIKRALVINKDQAVQFLRSRRSIRSFTDQIPDKEDLGHLIDIARYAPTASNAQPVEWTLFTDREKIEGLSKLTVDWIREVVASRAGSHPPYMPAIIGAWEMGIDAVLRGAPVLLVASAPKEDASGMVDVTLALSYFELAAPLFGLGTCWAGLLQGAMVSSTEVKAAVELPEGHIHHYPMMVGVPKPNYFRLPERRKPSIHWKEVAG